MVAVGESTRTQYTDNKPKQLGDNVQQPKPADIGKMLATGDVEQPAQQTSESQPVSQPQAPTADTSSNETFYGYTIDELRKYLLKRSDDNTSFEDLKNEAEKAIDGEIKTLNSEGFLTKEQKQILDKIFPKEDDIKKAIIRAYFNAASISRTLVLIVEEGLQNESAETLRNVYDTKCDLHVSGDNGALDNDNDNNNEIIKLIKRMNAAGSFEEKSKIFIEFIKNFQVGFNSALKKFNLELTIDKLIGMIIETIQKKSEIPLETKKAMLASIKEFPDSEQLGSLTAIINSCKTDDEKIELIKGLEFETLKTIDKDALQWIINFVSDKLGTQATDEQKAQLESLNNISSDGKITDEARKALLAFLPILTGGNLARPEDEQADMTGLGEAIEENCTEEEKRRIYEGVNDLWNQHPDWFQGVNQDKFTEIMNRISNGNYGIVVEDILRGDGVHSPLNMPSSNGNNSNGGSANTSVNNYGTGASSTSSTSSAQNAQTGFFNVQPQSVIYNTQNNLAQLKQQVQKASAQNNTPQLVTSATDIDSALASGEKLEEVVKTQIKENGVTGFVKDVLNSKVAIKCAYVKDKALTYFDSMSADIKRITFDGIHNTSNAILAARRLSLTELGKVHAQNIYVKENLEEIEEEKKKQEKLS